MKGCLNAPPDRLFVAETRLFSDSAAVGHRKFGGVARSYQLLP
jgi:hypothetical protein